MRLPRRYAYLMNGEVFSNLGLKLSRDNSFTRCVFSRKAIIL
jgi:hypothetical protein